MLSDWITSLAARRGVAVKIGAGFCVMGAVDMLKPRPIKA